MEAKKNIIHPKYKIKKRPKKEPNAHTKKKQSFGSRFSIKQREKKIEIDKKIKFKKNLADWVIETAY